MYSDYIEDRFDLELADIRGRIRNVQKKLHFTNREMADYLRVTESTYVRYLSGDIKIPVERVMLLVSELGVNANFILAGEEESEVFRDKKRLSMNGIEYSLLNLNSMIETERRAMSDQERLKNAHRLFELGEELTR